jgi:hypothetical protein
MCAIFHYLEARLLSPMTPPTERNGHGNYEGPILCTVTLQGVVRVRGVMGKLSSAVYASVLRSEYGHQKADDRLLQTINGEENPVYLFITCRWNDNFYIFP